MATDLVYVWGQYQQGSTKRWTSPHVLPSVGTGTGGSAVSMVDADASFMGLVAGTVAWGIGENGGNQINQTATNPQVVPQQIGASTDGGSGFSWPNPPLQVKGGANWWCWSDTSGGCWTIGSSAVALGQNVGTASTNLVPTQVYGTGDTSGATKLAVFPHLGSVSGGSDHAICLRSDGLVVGWGGNQYGQVGDGSTLTNGQSTGAHTQYLVPLLVVAGAGPSSGGSLNLGTGTSPTPWLSCGNKHSVALTSSGVLYAWGQDYFGQLGDGVTVLPLTLNNNQSSPVAVLTPWATAHAGTTIVAVSAGGGQDQINGQTLAIDSRGNLWGWGCNAQGQLGLPTSTAQYSTPQLIMGPDSGGAITATVTACTSGTDHGMALAGGILYVFGNNANGQLGLTYLGTGITSTPTPINSGAHAALPTSGTVNLIFAGNLTSIVDVSTTPPPNSTAATLSTAGFMGTA